ncbi:hypothetical protein OKW11_000118 [Pseudomonas baetica]|nr:hypothetical protein [Pseudomonas baetica]
MGCQAIALHLDTGKITSFASSSEQPLKALRET